MTSMIYPGRTPFKNQFQFFQPASHLSPDVNPINDGYYIGPELTFSPHHMLYSQIKASENTTINSWRVIGLSTVLSLTCLLVVFYILKIIWKRFHTHNSEFDGLIQDSPTECSAIEETDLNNYGSLIP